MDENISIINKYSELYWVLFTHGINFYSICALILFKWLLIVASYLVILCAYMLLEGSAHDVSITSYTYRLTTRLQSGLIQINPGF